MWCGSISVQICIFNHNCVFSITPCSAILYTKYKCRKRGDSQIQFLFVFNSLFSSNILWNHFHIYVTFGLCTTVASRFFFDGLSHLQPSGLSSVHSGIISKPAVALLSSACLQPPADFACWVSKSSSHVHNRLNLLQESPNLPHKCPNLPHQCPNLAHTRLNPSHKSPNLLWIRKGRA